MKKKYGLLGMRIDYSFSPKMHNRIFEWMGETHDYELYDVKQGDLKAFIDFAKAELEGFNITKPYKADIFSYVDLVGEEAEQIGAINTVKISGGSLIGFNTDVYGFEKTLDRNAVETEGKKVLVIGAGGASKAIVFALLKRAASVTIANRTLENAEKMKSEMEKIFARAKVSVQALDALTGDYDILINTTTVGLDEKDPPILARRYFEQASHAIDLIYKPAETAFLKKAALYGCEGINGFEMLVFQGIRAQEIWRGVQLTETASQELYEAVRKICYGEVRKMRIEVINGPNLNLLGIREPDIYGKKDLPAINEMIQEAAGKLGMKTHFFQSNHEGAIIDHLHQCMGKVDWIIINAAAYTHYSYAIRDAIKGIGIPTIEVHLSDIEKREGFRKLSVIKDVCETQISGYGDQSYIRALEYIKEKGEGNFDE